MSLNVIQHTADIMESQSGKLQKIIDLSLLIFWHSAPRSLCRSVHAEANAIISAARRDMVGGTIYLVGRDYQTGELLGDATSCAMCRRQIINAGLERVVIRRTPTEYEVVPVQQWIDEDDSLQ